MLCEYVCRGGGEADVPVWEAIQMVRPEAAIPELRRLMDRKEPVGCQLFAIGCVRIWGPRAKALVPDLIRILEDPPRIRDRGWMKASTHESAADALASIGPDAAAALPVLVRMAQHDAPENKFDEAIRRIRAK